VRIRKFSGLFASITLLEKTVGPYPQLISPFARDLKGSGFNRPLLAIFGVFSASQQANKIRVQSIKIKLSCSMLLGLRAPVKKIP
jgi:hypothetical protein